MNIKKKLMFSGLLIALLPIIIVSFTLKQSASTQSRSALEYAEQQRLISTSELTKRHIETYFNTVDGQIRSFSQNRMVIDAAKGFKLSHKVGFGTFMGNREEDLKREREAMTGYYRNNFSTEYKKRNGGKSIDVEKWISSLDDSTVEHQYRYIQENPNPMGEKRKLADLGDGSVYNHQHKQYHASFRDYLETFGYYDIFIVEPESGRIIYSVHKELDFFTSLKDGPLAQTGLGEAFRLANEGSGTDFTAMTDFAPYAPSYHDQAAFISSPIFDGEQKVGILIFQLPINLINGILTHHQKWPDVGLGASGETYIVAGDKQARSISRFLLEDQEAYFKMMAERGMSADLINSIKTKGSNIGLQQIDTQGVNAALAGEAGFATFSGYRGKEVLSAYTPLNIKGVNWVLMTEIDTEEAFAPIEALNSSILGTTLLLLAIIVAVVIALSIWFSGTIANPIVSLSRTIVAVGENADLSLRAPIESRDEIGSAAEAFNETMEKMAQSIGHVNDAATQLSTAAGKTATTSGEMNRAFEEQRSQTAQVATAITEMSSTVDEVANNTTRTAQLAHEANVEVGQGQQAMLETIKMINQLSSEIDGAAVVINELEQNSNEIGTVLEVIQGIAEQTNLLALNAAIEAARAGEQGRGFAVVADEVRTLASRTQSSTAEIHRTIEKLHAGSRRGVEAVNQSQERAKEAVSRANQTGNALKTIVNAVHQINDMTTQIASATEEQSAVSGEINRNVVQIEQMTQQSVAGSQQMAQASEDISALAHELKGLVGMFKL